MDEKAPSADEIIRHFSEVTKIPERDLRRMAESEGVDVVGMFREKRELMKRKRKSGRYVVMGGIASLISPHEALAVEVEGGDAQ